MAKLGSFKIYKDTASNLASIVLEEDEMAFDTTNKQIYLGDGSSTVANLSPFIGGGTSLNDITTGEMLFIGMLNQTYSICIKWSTSGTIYGGGSSTGDTLTKNMLGDVKYVDISNITSYSYRFQTTGGNNSSNSSVTIGFRLKPYTSNFYITAGFNIQSINYSNIQTGTVDIASQISEVNKKEVGWGWIGTPGSYTANFYLAYEITSFTTKDGKVHTADNLNY